MPLCCLPSCECCGWWVCWTRLLTLLSALLLLLLLLTLPCRKVFDPPAFSRYLTPPCTSFVDLLLVPLAKSSRSIIAAFRPLWQQQQS
jgi:hypothetical protein